MILVHILSTLAWGHLICGLISLFLYAFYFNVMSDKDKFVDYVNEGLESSGYKFRVNFSFMIVFIIISGYYGLAQNLVTIASHKSE